MNLQNIPRDDLVIKRAIVPKLGALSFFDYSAIEPRLWAYYAAKLGYPDVAELVKSGIDPYTAVARLVTGQAEVTKAERQVWKRIFLAVLYGAGIRRVGEVWLDETGEKLTRNEAKIRLFAVKDSLPGFAAVQKMVGRKCKERGYIIGIDGRRLHPEPYGEHKMVNKLIQGGAAGIMKQATVRVHRWLLDDGTPYGALQSHIISIVHDELQIDGPEFETQYLNAEVPRLMVHQAVNEIVPIEVEHEVSTTNWADKIPYDEWKGSP